MKKILLFLAVFTITYANAQSVLVKDIENGSLSSAPSYEFNRVDANGKLIFSALNNTTNNYGVWITDGTESGTKLLTSTVGNASNVVPKYFTYLNSVNKVFFKAASGNSAPSLWSTDGTEANTLPDNSFVFPDYITELNNKIYFSGQITSSGLGFELLHTDGTNSSTIDLNIGGNSAPRELKTIGNKLYFSAIANNLEGREPCISDGTVSGTYRIKNIKSGLNGSDPVNFTSFNNKVYFSADDGVNGRELWVTDGTAANTVMVADLNPGADPSLDPNEPTIFTVYKDELYFTAYTTATGNELFKVNASGNIINVADINPGASGHSNPKNFFVFDAKLYFSADDGTNGEELWVLNNTGSSTAKSSSKLTTTVAMLKDISVGGGSSKPNEFIEFQGKLYFNANDGVNDKELWVTDGTAAGTVMVQNINSSGDGNPRDFIVSNDLLYFSANDGIHGDELWKFSNNPIIGSLDPIDNGIEVSIDSKLKITFNKDVQKNNGNITIYDASDDSVVETINITSANITINGSQVTIEPSTNFTLAKQYYVQIDNGAIKDVNNTLFSGISDKTTWNFETIGKQNQTITFNTVPAKNFRDSDFQLTASASSNLAVSYTSSNTNVATISGNTVTIIGSGTTTITASQLGDANYNAAADVTQNLTINKINQTITFSSLIGKTFGDTDFQLTATSSSNLPITYTSSNTNAVTISGDIATIVGAGTTIITASQVGNSNYNAANNTNQILTVSNASQTITFTLNFTNNRVYGQAPRTLNASSDSGLPITYTSSDPSVIAVNGNVISFVGVGNGIIITAKQAGNNNYSAAPDVTQTINVSKAGQIITFNPPTNVTYGGQNFFLTATSNSGIPMTFTSLDSNIITLSGNEAFILNAGSTSLQASNNGNAFYIAYASVKTITVNKANQSIIFNSLPNVGVNDSDFNLTAVSTGGLPVSYSSSNPSVASVNGNVVSVHSLGTTTFTASQTGNNNYNAASNVSQTLTVSNTASINDFEKLAFEIYPNPTSSVFQIKSNLTIDKVEIYNLLGQKVKQFTSLNSKEFSISQLKNGLYLIKIYTEKGIGSKRIMKISR